ncbi:LTA synthase family protein [Geomobilimonas luticola]|uniref:LTA synthase family protein n=1 Tax=Geomobilimonas luticola TaxID=1114878 RepID=A0ABS5SD24_9BACT|nr:LTA synthase family protein [Geomobilimonas luticola]MBT0653276.1 LTA synthase family protein [Geomobilimonas luticola]
MSVAKRYHSLYVLFAIIVIFSTITRTILLIKALPNLDLSPFLLLKIYGVGFFFDCVTYSYFAIPFALVAVLLPDKVFNGRWFRPVVWVVGFVLTYLMLFNTVAEYTFFDEFGTRYNFIAIDYLIYTTEVIRNIRESYPVNGILAALFLLNIGVFTLVKKRLNRSFASTSTLGKRLRAGLLFAILPVMSYLCVDLSLTNISPNNYADELAGNGIYNLVAAFRNNELDYNRFYVSRDDKLILARLRGLLTEKNNHLASSDTRDITRIIQHPGQERHLNIIVIVEESLSAEYLGAFGNTKGLTPNLDKLADESLFFTHLYATGTRTVRGLEAITLSIPPLPGTSIVKRPGNENFFSWGSVMKAKGYDNKFIYAGHGYFDNMNYFFANNGFSTIDRLNFAKDEVTFSNAWGVCDEDLFGKVISEADKSHKERRPFFSMVMTTSNHRPFTYPDGKIDIPSKTGRDGGVKYADYAIGRLLTEARKHPWFNDTVFVIVADHCAGSARKIALPVKNYEIPLFIYAPGRIKPQKIDRMLSQIDIAPTVLGLLNFSYTTRFAGKNIMNMADGEERAFISTYQKLGFIKGDKLLVLGPQKETGFYSFSRQDGATTQIPPQEGLLLDGLGYYQGMNYVYKNRLNRLNN